MNSTQILFGNSIENLQNLIQIPFLKTPFIACQNQFQIPALSFLFVVAVSGGKHPPAAWIFPDKTIDSVSGCQTKMVLHHIMNQRHIRKLQGFAKLQKKLTVFLRLPASCPAKNLQQRFPAVNAAATLFFVCFYCSAFPVFLLVSKEFLLENSFFLFQRLWFLRKNRDVLHDRFSDFFLLLFL